MPRPILQLAVFVSSPGGLSQDRGAVQVAMEEANRILDAEGLMLRPFFWEKDAVPTRGDGYAQTAINSKIESETDVLILLMHSRVGTATPTYMSGTIEEFEVAHSINESNSRRIEICIYFSVAPISPLVDLDQLRSVQEFRRRVHDLGYLSRDYDDVGGFSASLIPHLVEKARTFQQDGNQRKLSALLEPQADDVVHASEEEEAPGFLDYEELVASHITNATEKLEDIANITREIGEITGRYSEKVERINALSSQGVSVNRKSIIDEYANELNIYNNRLEPVVLDIDSSLSAGAAAALNLLQEWPIDSPESREAVKGLADTIGTTLMQMDAMIEPVGTMAATLESWPGLTKRLKEARKRAVGINRRLYATMRRSQQLLADAQDVGIRRLEAN